jgi:hypothetical protein
MGFTLNNMTLLGITLAVGIVIDDAIVVLENIFRYIEEKHCSRRRSSGRAPGRGWPGCRRRRLDAFALPRNRRRAEQEADAPPHEGRVSVRAIINDTSSVTARPAVVSHNP